MCRGEQRLDGEVRVISSLQQKVSVPLHASIVCVWGSRDSYSTCVGEGDSYSMCVPVCITK